MLPETLTESQENIPDLTEKQLAVLGYESNHTWKINAKMLGYKEGVDLEDFIDTTTDKKIQSYKKGKQVAIFRYEGTKDTIDDFPLSLEGDFILQQKFEMINGEWQELDVFAYRSDLECIYALALPFGLSGNFSVVYGRFIDSPSGALKSYGYQESCENIIDLKEKESSFIKANNLHSHNSSLKNTKDVKYRIRKEARSDSSNRSVRK